MNEKFVALGWQPAIRQTTSLRYIEPQVHGEQSAPYESAVLIDRTKASS
jgi:hypothetical protein